MTSAKGRTPDTAHGKALEKDLSSVMLPLEALHPIVFERVIDSAYAGNVIRDAECDFKLTVRSPQGGRPYLFLIECKASSQSSTFSENFRGLVKNNQLGLMRKHDRAGACCFYLYRSLLTGVIEVWSLRDIVAWYYNKRVKMVSLPIHTFRGPDGLRQLSEMLIKNTAPFVKSITG